MRVLVIARLLSVILDSADDFAINEPVDLLRLPVVGIGVERALWIVDRLLSAPIVAASNTFSKVIGLNKTFVLSEIVT